MKNQAAVLYAPHDVRLEERTMPHVGPRDVMIEVKKEQSREYQIHRRT
jgi:L-iditol 2-dehydrogenase